MTLPTRWNPIRQMPAFDSFPEFQDLIRNLGMRPLSRQVEDVMEMRLDVNEDEKCYRVTVDVPGVKKENIDVSIEGNKISISAEVKREVKHEKEKELYSERYSGRAFRAFTLPSEIDSAKAEARYDGGVLTLTLPKKADSSSRKVSVN